MAPATTPMTLILPADSLIALRFLHQLGTLILVVSWSFYVSFLTLLDPGNTFANARTEGCLGTPTLFIALVAAICVGMIFYTPPNEARET